MASAEEHWTFDLKGILASIARRGYDLATIAKLIRKSHAEAERRFDMVSEHGKLGFQYVLSCGCYLLHAKKTVGHGKFSPWLKKHAPNLPRRTATRYMHHARSFLALDFNAKKTINKQIGQVANFTAARLQELIDSKVGKKVKEKKGSKNPAHCCPFCFGQWHGNSHQGERRRRLLSPDQLHQYEVVRRLLVEKKPPVRIDDIMQLRAPTREQLLEVTGRETQPEIEAPL